MRKIVILVLMGLVINLFAISNEIRFDILKTKLIQESKSKRYSQVLSTMKELKALGKKLPSSLVYFEGKALFETGETYKAYEKFEEYLSVSGKEGKYYNQSISYIIKSEPIFDKEKTSVQNGLMWQEQIYSEKEIRIFKNSDYDNPKFYKRVQSWEGAIKYCKNLNYARHSDWRLPYYEEMKSLYYDEKKYTKFGLFNFWTYTGVTGKPNYAFAYNASTREMHSSRKKSNYATICVRKAQK